MPLSHDGSNTVPPETALGARLDDATPYEALLGGIDEVLAEWRELMMLEPGTRIPMHRLLDSFPVILPLLIRLAQAGATHVDDELKSRITDEHGFFRREDAIPLVAVAQEWAHAKRACATVLRRRGFADASIADALRRLEVLIDDAVGYTLRGYYRDELNQLRGRGLERRDSGMHDRRAGPSDRRRGDGPA